MHRELPSVAAVGAYELWFVAQLSVAAGYMGGAMFLLPPFVLSLPGSGPGDVGMVMAILSLVALGAPIVGVLLDRHGRFRAFQHLGLGLVVVGFAVLAVSRDISTTALGATVLGVGATFAVITNLAILAGSGLDESQLAGRMSMLLMSIPAGQFIGLAAIAALLGAEVPFSDIFVVMAGLALVGLLATALTNGSAIGRTLDHRQRSGGSHVGHSGRSLRSVLMSGFGLVLLVLFLSTTAVVTLESQYPNFMAVVFDVDGDVAALGVAVAVLVSMPLFGVVGRWARSVPYKYVLLAGSGGRAAAGFALWLIAGGGRVPAAVPLALYGALVIMIPFSDVSGALLVAASSPLGPGGGQGGFGFALAAAGAAGAAVGGWAAGVLGFRSLALVAGVIASVAFLLSFVLPGHRALGRR